MLYFAYGSNLNVKQMHERCPGATIAGRAVLDGWRFEINERGVATLVRESDAEVHGVLWEITAAHEAELDLCEGVAIGCYQKHQLELRLESLENGTTQIALVYIDPRHRPAPAREGYLERVIQGATEQGLSAAYIAEVLTPLADR